MICQAVIMDRPSIMAAGAIIPVASEMTTITSKISTRATVTGAEMRTKRGMNGTMIDFRFQQFKIIESMHDS